MREIRVHGGKAMPGTKRLLFSLAAITGIVCFGCQTVEPFQGPDRRLGIVLLHGKNGSPDGYIGSLARALRRAGASVENPEMPWSRYRGFDRDYEESIREIDAAVRRLKARGAQRIVVGGHSLGAGVALGYAARRPGLAGVIVLAPGHWVGMRGFQRKIRFDYRKARRMVRAGRGEEYGNFYDINQGRLIPRSLKARIYLSWFDPQGPANYQRNVQRIGLRTPILWVVGRKDRLALLGVKHYGFARASGNPKSRYVEIDSNHLQTPNDAIPVVIRWLRSLR
jgi:pimeloyl-ACP methyl ester carboxylesterase